MEPTTEQQIRQEELERDHPSYSREYIPSKNELRQRHEVNIQFLSYGCVVRVGCKSIAFIDYKEAIDAVKAYAEDPIAAYKKWGVLLDVKF
jgi:hypothetical protein